FINIKNLGHNKIKKITCLFLSASNAHHLYELALLVDLVLLDILVKCLERHYNKIVSDLLCKACPCRGCRCDAKVAVVPLQRRSDLVGACADLASSEWQRSRAARIHSLEKFCDGFPVCLVLVSQADQLLGHARLSLVVSQPRSIFVEMVVVSRELREKGYGCRLMEATERYARSRGFWRLWLITHDKQHFYAHLGFVLSEPVQNAGSVTTFMPKEVLQRFSRPPATGREGEELGLNRMSSPPPVPPLAPLPPFETLPLLVKPLR
ncbi:N-alpha-acetyltransferase 80-like, partial [Polyodon spathula]|uniref:N-alpha-acetyltransferase 80-like n=1 Tax=Polyodon spathula TaxID=7913 RepID=UPI001B7F6C9E